MLDAKPSFPLDAHEEALVRLLRTLLEEANGLLTLAEPREDTSGLSEAIGRLQHELTLLAPDFRLENLQNGPPKG